MYKFMNELKDAYNKRFKDEIAKGEAPRCFYIVTNDMTSNYYFDLNGEESYVDQFTLQEHFDYDDDDETVDRYSESSFEDKVEALSELAFSNYNLL